MPSSIRSHRRTKIHSGRMQCIQAGTAVEDLPPPWARHPKNTWTPASKWGGECPCCPGLKLTMAHTKSSRHALNKIRAELPASPLPDEPPPEADLTQAAGGADAPSAR